MPLLNDVQAAGLTPAALAAQITESLKKYVTNPQVTVIVTTINSQRVYLLGEVSRPGSVPDDSGNDRACRRFRAEEALRNSRAPKASMCCATENGKQVKYPFNYKEVISGKKPEQDIPLKAGDTIVVP